MVYGHETHKYGLVTLVTHNIMVILEGNNLNLEFFKFILVKKR